MLILDWRHGTQLAESLRKCTALGTSWQAHSVEKKGLLQFRVWRTVQIVAGNNIVLLYSLVDEMHKWCRTEQWEKRRTWAAGVVSGLFFRFGVLVCASNASKRWRVCPGGRVGDCFWGWGRAQGKLGNRRVSASGFCFGLASAGGLFRVWLSGVVTHPTHSSTPRCCFVDCLFDVVLLLLYFWFVWCWGAGLFLVCVLFIPVGSGYCCFLFCLMLGCGFVFDVSWGNRVRWFVIWCFWFGLMWVWFWCFLFFAVGSGVNVDRSHLREV